MLFLLPQMGTKKDAHQRWRLLRPFSVLLIFLSIISLTYGDFAFNSKTLPILSQNTPNFVSRAGGKEFFKDFQRFFSGEPPQHRAQGLDSLFPQTVIGTEADVTDMGTKRVNDFFHIF